MIVDAPPVKPIRPSKEGDWNPEQPVNENRQRNEQAQRYEPDQRPRRIAHKPLERARFDPAWMTGLRCLIDCGWLGHRNSVRLGFWNYRMSEAPVENRLAILNRGERPTANVCGFD